MNHDLWTLGNRLEDAIPRVVTHKSSWSIHLTAKCTQHVSKHAMSHVRANAHVPSERKSMANNRQPPPTR